MTTESPSGQNGISEHAIKRADDARAAYTVLAARAQGYNHLQWQTPSLALTAEAFVLQIALGHESTPPARLVASALNLMLSLLCIQLMAKHREAQIDDRKILIKLKDRLGLPRYRAKPCFDDLEWWKRRLRTSSTKIWMIGFGVLAAVALGIFVVTLGGCCGIS